MEQVTIAIGAVRLANCYFASHTACNNVTCQVRGKAKAWIRWHSHSGVWERGRASNREICKDCPTSNVRIRSVDELLEQGNAFEAEAVKGVEDAGDSDEGEVRTHEVPQDDVRGEYVAKE